MHLAHYKLTIMTKSMRLRARVGRPQTSGSPPIISLLAVQRRLFRFGSLVILDSAYCYLWLFSLYIHILK